MSEIREPSGREPGMRQCPRCGRWFRWPEEYAEHAWYEKP